MMSGSISRLPFLFIITGMVCFALFHGISLWTAYDWVSDVMRGPFGWFQAHLFVLGWATMLAMGAVYQLINVILVRPIYNERLSYVQYGIFTIGVVGLLLGFYHAQTIWISLFASISFVGVSLFACNIGMTLLRAKQWHPITISAACAIIYLALTGLTGFIMGLNFTFGGWFELHERLFGAHIWLGSVGWFGLLITGFSYKLLPMFYLSHNYPTRLQPVILILWNAAVISGTISLLSGGQWLPMWLSLLMITVAFIIYNIHLLQIRKYRHKPHPGAGIKWSVYMSQAMALFAVLLTIYSLWFPERILADHTVIVTAWVYLGGWVSLTILGYASKIVPFLWWTYKYGGMVGKPGTPTMSELLSDHHVRLGIIIVMISISGLFVGLYLQANLIAAVFGIAFSLLSILYMALMASVFAR